MPMVTLLEPAKTFSTTCKKIAFCDHVLSNAELIIDPLTYIFCYPFSKMLLFLIQRLSASCEFERYYLRRWMEAVQYIIF